MAKIHDKFVIELAEVIKGYGNDPDVDDPFCLSEFYRFYELPNIAVSRENFEKMRPVEPERKRGDWIPQDHNKRNGYATTTVYYYPKCSVCGKNGDYTMRYCPNCGADMRGEQDD